MSALVLSQLQFIILINGCVSPAFLYTWQSEIVNLTLLGTGDFFVLL